MTSKYYLEKNTIFISITNHEDVLKTIIQKKIKKSDDIKQDKKSCKKKRKTATTDNEDTCKRCHEKGHKSARSPSYKYHISSKQEVFNKNLGQKYRPFTRKLPMDKCVADQCVNTLKPIIISACRDVRNIVFRAQIFVNYYITLRSQQELDNDIPHCIFQQQFWYSVCQLVNAKRVTTSTNIPPNMLAVWNVFQSQYSSIVYHQQIAGGTSQCLAEACTELATSYLITWWNILNHAFYLLCIIVFKASLW